MRQRMIRQYLDQLSTLRNLEDTLEAVLFLYRHTNYPESGSWSGFL